MRSFALRFASFLMALSAISISACGDDAATSTGTGGSAGAGGGEPLPEVEGCDGAKLLASPAATDARGPWAVGAREATIGELRAEVWYPAKPAQGETSQPAPKSYDLRAWLPDSEVGKIPDALAPVQACDCVADLPLDEAHGPYPVIVFVHGTAGFRSQSLELVTHWASRGFVVVAADHPGLYLKDLLQGVCDGQFPGMRDLGPDLDAIVAAVKAPSGDLAFLAERIDASRIGMAGHSAGGAAIADRGGDARVLVPMAAGGTQAGAQLESTLVLGAQNDKVVQYGNTKSGFASSPSPRRLVGLAPAGHLAFSSLCAITNDDGQDIVEVGKAQDVCGLALAGALFDCDPSYLAAEKGWALSGGAAAAAFEEVLHCNAERGSAFADLASRYPELVELVEE